MAKRIETKPANGKSKLTVMAFHLEGSDETLLESIKQISHAISSTIRPQQRVLLQADGAPTRVGSDDSIEADSTPNAADLDNGSEEVGEADSVDSTGSNSPIVAPRKQIRERSPQIVDFDAKSAAVPLADYCAQKSAGESDLRRYLVIICWLKEQMKIEQVTMDHVHTCYRLLNWPTPPNAGQPLRSLKHKGWLVKGEGTGVYKINHVGENRVHHLNGA